SSSAETDKDGYQKITIPWNLTVNYSIRYANTNVFDYKKMEYKMGFTHNLSLSGSISLTSKWNISSSTSYDFVAKQFTYTNVSVSRDLHCWNISANFVPFGPFQSYYFRIGVNSSMLRDLKYEKRSGYGSTPIDWY
ncbi:MAG TPA: LPS-assembly protein LptD, partial [Paludibacteraceae bacterium]|nr:LPS-assembly protein LptD [Paludibacteraceae bacterium]